MPNRQRSLGKKNKVNYSCSDLPAKCKFSFRRRKKKRKRDVSIYRHFFTIFFTFQDIFPDKSTERKILSLIIKCPSEGCEWTGELRGKEVSIETEWCVQLTIGCPACWLPSLRVPN